MLSTSTTPSFTLVVSTPKKVSNCPAYRANNIETYYPYPKYPLKLQGDPLMVTVDYRFEDLRLVSCCNEIPTVLAKSLQPTMPDIPEEDETDLEESVDNVERNVAQYERKRGRLSALVVDMAFIVRRTCKRYLVGQTRKAL
ncbi:hypothetical protein JAAARDRAFT_28700 [Jaapia argillacea MUCL 33604]|uniref:Uncharacterized protein n=1 Tax=Jaapia argillacea MUCL 33604 TaxID=933084 RepID=A0A067QDM2_9AGAM|nr:hypothetical protein JAAARDRAFT_28700 [Jaapia argillacea MUCL 33604]